jgi:CheY-like chemotaxis protein
MVYGFVQQSGGEMRVYSEPGHGTTMRLLLPRGSEDNVREEPILRDIPVVGRGQRILLVEDETHLREAMTDLITNLGYKVDVALSGKSALELIEAGKKFDLLLTDIVMPGGISGFDLAAKARVIRPELPIIYMSGYAAYTDREMGVVIAPLLQKPCSPRVLAERLQTALN